MYNQPLARETVRAGNRMMVERILGMDVQPYTDEVGVYRVVEIRGRRTGESHRVPLAVYQYQQQRYLIAPSRGRDWVYNLLAAGTCVLVAKGQREQVRATLTLDDEAIRATQAYMAQLPDWALQQFPFPASASAEEMRSKKQEFVVFRLEPLS
ncbi:hypothetical protein KDA_50030 [Dictyobacter alpinus]|uniref:Nitroreductase n=1 Tax=Dictyobacter alpinus TaxID=2014873 RepID=A0A402BDW6_9CHLR|nr:nitroreductase/quinone reductase family protein [Dictyobacter alpinus]GCE29519.1 hypothetical protein KDA_50030 [Dictyobacter alpinus]